MTFYLINAEVFGEPDVHSEHVGIRKNQQIFNTILSALSRGDHLTIYCSPSQIENYKKYLGISEVPSKGAFVLGGLSINSDNIRITTWETYVKKRGVGSEWLSNPQAIGNQFLKFALSHRQGAHREDWLNWRRQPDRIVVIGTGPRSSKICKLISQDPVLKSARSHVLENESRKTFSSGYGIFQNNPVRYQHLIYEIDAPQTTNNGPIFKVGGDLVAPSSTVLQLLNDPVKFDHDFQELIKYYAGNKALAEQKRLNIPTKLLRLEKQNLSHGNMFVHLLDASAFGNSNEVVQIIKKIGLDHSNHPLLIIPRSNHQAQFSLIRELHNNVYLAEDSTSKEQIRFLFDNLASTVGASKIASLNVMSNNPDIQSAALMAFPACTTLVSLGTAGQGNAQVSGQCHFESFQKFIEFIDEQAQLSIDQVTEFNPLGNESSSSFCSDAIAKVRRKVFSDDSNHVSNKLHRALREKKFEELSRRIMAKPSQFGGDPQALDFANRMIKAARVHHIVQGELNEVELLTRSKATYEAWSNTAFLAKNLPNLINGVAAKFETQLDVAFLGEATNQVLKAVASFRHQREVLIKYEMTMWKHLLSDHSRAISLFISEHGCSLEQAQSYAMVRTQDFFVQAEKLTGPVRKRNQAIGKHLQQINYAGAFISITGALATAVTGFLDMCILPNLAVGTNMTARIMITSANIGIQLTDAHVALDIKDLNKYYELIEDKDHLRQMINQLYTNEEIKALVARTPGNFENEHIEPGHTRATTNEQNENGLDKSKVMQFRLRLIIQEDLVASMNDEQKRALAQLSGSPSHWEYRDQLAKWYMDELKHVEVCIIRNELAEMEAQNPRQTISGVQYIYPNQVFEPGENLNAVVFYGLQDIDARSMADFIEKNCPNGWKAASLLFLQEQDDIFQLGHHDFVEYGSNLDQALTRPYLESVLNHNHYKIPTEVPHMAVFPRVASSGYFHRVTLFDAENFGIEGTEQLGKFLDVFNRRRLLSQGREHFIVLADNELRTAVEDFNKIDGQSIHVQSSVDFDCDQMYRLLPKNKETNIGHLNLYTNNSRLTHEYMIKHLGRISCFSTTASANDQAPYQVETTDLLDRLSQKERSKWWVLGRYAMPVSFRKNVYTDVGRRQVAQRVEKIADTLHFLFGQASSPILLRGHEFNRDQFSKELKKSLAGNVAFANNIFERCTLLVLAALSIGNKKIEDWIPTYALISATQGSLLNLSAKNNQLNVKKSKDFENLFYALLKRNIENDPDLRYGFNTYEMQALVEMVSLGPEIEKVAAQFRSEKHRAALATVGTIGAGLGMSLFSQIYFGGTTPVMAAVDNGVEIGERVLRQAATELGATDLNATTVTTSTTSTPSTAMTNSTTQIQTMSTAVDNATTTLSTWMSQITSTDKESCSDENLDFEAERMKGILNFAGAALVFMGQYLQYSKLNKAFEHQSEALNVHRKWENKKKELNNDMAKSKRVVRSLFLSAIIRQLEGVRYERDEQSRAVKYEKAKQHVTKCKDLFGNFFTEVQEILNMPFSAKRCDELIGLFESINLKNEGKDWRIFEEVHHNKQPQDEMAHDVSQQSATNDSRNESPLESTDTRSKMKKKNKRKIKSPSESGPVPIEMGEITPNGPSITKDLDSLAIPGLKRSSSVPLGSGTLSAGGANLVIRNRSRTI